MMRSGSVLGLNELFTLARSMAKDMTLAEEEIKELVKLISSGRRPKRDPNTKQVEVDENQNIIYEHISIDDQIQAIYILMLYIPPSEKRRIPDNTLQLLMKFSEAIRNFENRTDEAGTHIALERARIMQEKSRVILSALAKTISPYVLKLTKGVSGEDLQLLISEKQKATQTPSEENLRDLFNQ